MLEFCLIANGNENCRRSFVISYITAILNGCAQPPRDQTKPLLKK